MENEEPKTEPVVVGETKDNKEPVKKDPTALATIEEWVNTLDIAPASRPEYVKLLSDQEITISLLSSLTETDLTELGVTKIGPRKAMLRAIELLKSKDEKKSGASRRSTPSRQRKKDVPPPEPLPPPTVVINELDHDLDLKVKLVTTDNSIHCWPYAMNNFVHLWSGARANYGVQSGKYWFEFAMTELTDPRKVKDDFTMLGKTGCRVGWSTLDTQVDMAGDAPTSFAYDCDGLKANNRELTDYGEKYYVGDTLGCFLNLDQYTVSFSKNGQWHGVAFIIPEDLRNKTFYPHMSCKNVKVKFNFGAQAAVTPVPQGYEFIESAPKDKLVPGLTGSADKKDYEVLVPVGLPLAGKTEWVNKWVAEHPEKHYTVLGNEYIVNRLKVWTLPDTTDESLARIKKEKVQRFVHRIAGFTGSLFTAIVNQFVKKSHPRNYILDSTNLSWDSRALKLENFEGYGTKIAVCFTVPAALLDSRSRAVKRTIAGVPLENIGASFSQKGRFELPEETDAKIVELPALDLPEPIPPEEPKKEEKGDKEDGEKAKEGEEGGAKEDGKDKPQEEEGKKENENHQEKTEEKTEPVKEEGKETTDVVVSTEEDSKKEKEDVVMSQEQAKAEPKEENAQGETVKTEGGVEEPAPTTEEKKDEQEATKEEEPEKKPEKKPRKKLFDEIWFVGAKKEESTKIVEEYKEQAKKDEELNRARRGRGGGRGGRGRGGRFRDSRGRGRGGYRSNYGNERRYSTPDRYGGRDRYDDKRHYDARYPESDSSKRRYPDSGSSGGGKRRRYDDYSPRSVVAPVYSVPYSGYGSQYPPPTYVYQYAAAPVQYKSSSSYNQPSYNYRSSGQSSQRRSSSGSSRRY